MTAQQEDQAMLKYLNARDYQAQFLLDPDIKGLVDFIHLDKNLAITNLKHNTIINEVEEAKAILKALHVLNNPIHYKKEQKFVGHKAEKQEDGSILQVAVYREEFVPKFPKTFHNLKAEFISFVNVAAARGGHRIKMAITNRLEKEETIANKTQATKKQFNFKS